MVRIKERKETSLRLFMERNLVDIIVDRVNDFAKEYDPPFVYVFFSGGKDSAVSLYGVSRSVLRDRVVIVYTELVGNTHRLNVEQAYSVVYKLYGSSVNEVVVDTRDYSWKARLSLEIREHKFPLFIHIKSYARGKYDFIEAIRQWGIPVIRNYGRTRRWCHNEFKAMVWDQLPPARGNIRYVVVGVKASDNPYRRMRWRTPTNIFRSKKYTDIALSPIFDLTTYEVINILGKIGLELNTYKIYGDSLNCIFCPLRGREKQLKATKSLCLDKELYKRWLSVLRSLSPRSEVTTRLRDLWIEALKTCFKQ